MSDDKAKQKGYTHLGSMYGIDIYMTDDEDMNVVGTTFLNDQLLKLFIWIDIELNINEDGFPILKGKKL